MINLKDLEGGGSGGLIDSPFEYRPGMPEKKNTTFSIRVTGVPVKIRTEHLPNVNRECCRHARMFSLETVAFSYIMWGGYSSFKKNRQIWASWKCKLWGDQYIQACLTTFIHITFM
jgi:hypothetical protein